jgi:hypothetical protein
MIKQSVKILLVFLALLAVPCWAQLATNSDFATTPPMTPGAGTYIYDPTNVSGWTFSGPTQNAAGGSYGSGVAEYGSAWNFDAATDGANQVAFLQNTATVTQTISGLTTGQQYTVSFYLEDRPGYSSNPIIVSMGGTTLLSTTPGSGWTLYTETFTATAASELLSFSTNASNGDIGLSDVTVYTITSTSSYPATDSFSGSGALSSNWTQAAPYGLSYPPVALVRSNGTVVPGASAPPTTYPWGLALHTGVTFTNDQYAQVVFVAHSTAGGRTGPCVLMSSVGSGYCYSGDDGVIRGYSDAIYDTIPVTGCPIPASGDTIKLSTVGSTLTCTDVTKGTSASGPASSGYHQNGMPGVFVDQMNSTVYALTSFNADCIPTCGTVGGTVATPTFSPIAGTYGSAQTVTISDSTSGATIHYTTDGSIPTASSTTYTAPITVSVSETVKAIGVLSGYTNSAVGSAAYVINLVVATPTFSPGAGTYSSAQTVTISDLTSGATIHYTTDGSTPTASSTTYSAPITVSVSETVKAIGVKSGYTNSQVGSAAYTIGGGSTHTWYIRSDGGTRYSSHVTAGQCNGMADNSYASAPGYNNGTGTNLNCAFNDFRYMWDDDSGVVGAGAWVIAGGDTVIIRGCHALSGQQNPANPDCRIGWDGPTGPASDNWCYGVGSYTCYNPPIPAGTASQHTRILGQCVLAGNCNTGNVTNRANLTQLFGGFSLNYSFNLDSTQYVDIEGIELTTHNGACSYMYGGPQYPRGCSNNQPLDDYASGGFLTNNTTANITFQDVYVDGFEGDGLQGPIGGPMVATRVFVGFNAHAGWNFDDGNDTENAAGSSIAASYVTMEGNGCKQQYPIVNTAFPALACWDTQSPYGGFGDAWSGQDTELDSFTCDHCVMEYNTKDAFIGPHTQIHTLTVTDSVSIGNEGAQWKWSSDPYGTVLFQNNLTVGNCVRMSQALPGAAQNFALSTGLGGSYLAAFCRGNAVFANNTRIGAVNNFYGNTVVSADNVTFQENCGYTLNANRQFYQETNCQTSQINLKDNNFLGYTDPAIGNVPALYCALNIGSTDCDSLPAGTGVQFTASYSDEFGLKSGTTDTCGSNGIICNDPKLVNEPALPWPGSESGLDNFNFTPSSTSPLLGAGVSVPGLTTDYNGTMRPNPPSLGGIE